jgi:hypothetical protein
MYTQTALKIFSIIFTSIIIVACGSAGKDSAAKILIEGNKSSATTTGTGGGSSSSVTNTNTIGADTLQSIEFIDASPTVTNLKGTGGAESSLVRFRVLGQTGSPIKNIVVNFALNTTVGGLALSQLSSKSDEAGFVSTSVLSGTIATSVNVTAAAKDNPSITTQSNLLVVSTGLPDQKSMSISTQAFNPIGWRYNGITTTIGVLLADAYNNPVADGTAVSFTAEGGSIGSSCTTTGGACNVKWTSQDPKPQRNGADTDTINDVLCLFVDNMGKTKSLEGALLYQCQAKRAGRVTILATALGNESFHDTNANGIFDTLDVGLFKTETGGNCTRNVPLSSFEVSTSACDDLPEAYLDKNESGTRDDEDPYTDIISGNTYSPNNGLYNGVFCQEADELRGFCSRKSITIRKDIVLVMSCDYALNINGFLPKIDSNYVLADCNGNSLPVGTKISLIPADPLYPEFILGSGTDWLLTFFPPFSTVKLVIPIDATTNAIRTYGTD